MALLREMLKKGIDSRVTFTGLFIVLGNGHRLYGMGDLHGWLGNSVMVDITVSLKFP